MTDDGLANIEGISECRSINLDGTNITDKGLKHLRGFAQLDSVHLRWTPISGHGLVHLQKSKGLKQLWLFGAAVDDEGIVNLKYLPSLQLLELDHNGNLTDKGFENVRFLKDLRRLVGGHGLFTDASLKAIGELSHLEKLWFYDTHVTSLGLTHLSGLPALDHLGLKGCRGVDDSVAVVLRGFRSLKSIELSDTAVTAAGAAKIRTALPNCTVGGFDNQANGRQ